MARQYFSFTIRADGLEDKAAFQYEASVLGMLHSMECFKTTHALLQGFRAYNREVLVTPNILESGEEECNARAKSDWGLYRTKILFSPTTYFRDSDCFETGAGNSPHEVLCHEMVHALRYVAGTNHKHTKKAQEERIAITVTNIFSSETHRKLRRKHDGHEPLKDPVKLTSSGYLQAYFKLIDLFCKEHPNVSSWLAGVETEFNPLREYYRGNRQRPS